MTLASTLRVFFFYILAVVVATVLATVVQTQINLYDLQQLDVPVSTADRLETTAKDLVGFTPLMGLLVAVSFIFALPAAEFAGRLARPLRMVLYFVAGAIGIWVAFRVTDALVPPPTFIAATRELPGTFAMMAAVATGSVLFGILTRSRTRPVKRAPDQSVGDDRNQRRAAL